MTDILLENKTSKFKQKKLLIITAIGLSGIIIAFLSSGPKKPSTSLSKTIEDSKNKILLQDPNKGIKSEDRWLDVAGKRLDDYGEFQKNYSQDKNNIESRLDKMEKDYEDTINAQSGLLESQGQEIQALKSQINASKQPNQANGKQDPFGAQGSGQNPNAMMPVAPKTIQTTTFDLEKTVDGQGDFLKGSEYVPAGAYASATIISGVDAPVGATAQTDPRPILLRVNGPAYSSAFEGEVQKADLKDCIITGASWGDLPSEKVYVKLVNMTCSKSEDLIFETAVKGYVAGQGKTGVRGDVISREGDFVAKSFLSGLVSGLGSGVSASVASPLAFSNGVTVQNGYSAGDIAKKGVGQGISNSSTMVADYLMKRAEQYQPVVSIPSGIEVNVVFVEGFALNGKRRRAPTSTNNSQFIQKNFNP
jgi:conjugal transfer pilus assembly protein TraB